MDALAAELEAFGVAGDELAAFRGHHAGREAPDEADVEVWPCMRPAVEVFAALRTQWRRTVVAGLAGGVLVWEGLRYEALPAVTAMLGHAPSPRLLADLQVMELEALRHLNREARR